MNLRDSRTRREWRALSTGAWSLRTKGTSSPGVRRAAFTLATDCWYETGFSGGPDPGGVKGGRRWKRNQTPVITATLKPVTHDRAISARSQSHPIGNVAVATDRWRGSLSRQGGGFWHLKKSVAPNCKTRQVCARSKARFSTPKICSQKKFSTLSFGLNELVLHQISFRSGKKFALRSLGVGGLSLPLALRASAFAQLRRDETARPASRGIHDPKKIYAASVLAK